MEDFQQITHSANVSDLQMEFFGLKLLQYFHSFIIRMHCIEIVTMCAACTTYKGLTKSWRCLWYCTNN